MNFSDYRYLVYSDLYRITGTVKITALLLHVVNGGSFKYNFWMRTCCYAKSNAILKCLIYPFAKFWLSRLTYKFGISIPPDTVIGSGFYIGHFGGIVINEKSRIGKNCNISQGVTLGQANRGKNKGFGLPHEWWARRRISFGSPRTLRG